MSGDLKKQFHIFLGNAFSEKSKYSRPTQGFSKTEIPFQDRVSHGGKLRGDLQNIKRDMVAAIEIQKKSGINLDYGILIRFESFEGFERAFEDLSYGKSGIELYCIRHENTKTYATVFVPDGKLGYFEKMIKDYQDEKKRIDGVPQDNQKIIDMIKSIHTATLRELWTDTDSEFPTNVDEEIWWEAWLATRSDREKTISAFHEYTQQERIITSKKHINFPQRTVFILKSSRKQMEQSMIFLNSIAELRRAKETAEFFTSLHPGEERKWIDDLIKRLEYPDSTKTLPYICVLDTGINRGHPLLENSIASGDLLTVDPLWGVNDKVGHGTAIAGVALLGDLTQSLITSDPILLSHRLESVKILNKDGDNKADDHFYASLTDQAVSRSKTNNPERIRIFQLAITANDYRDGGKPSAWSSVVDMMAFNRDSKNQDTQLFIVSGGNIQGSDAWLQYPKINEKEGIHDPGQAWNALTVGAYTEKTNITEPRTKDNVPIAIEGALSPFSSTSCCWDPQWPFKPDIVMEGGNVAKDAFGAVTADSLSVVTTNYIPTEKLFTTINATSSASALASHMAAQILSNYPRMCAETLRGLLVHSASWTDAMKSEYLGNPPTTKKSAYVNMIRHCGFGVPDLEMAVWTVRNSLTMIIVDSLQPFDKHTESINEMRFYKLPWPKEVLLGLGSQNVEMRVTLSYFIEPNPSSRGRTRYTYQSHGLRFDINQPTEELTRFKGRISAVYREDNKDDYSRDTAPDRWCLGIGARHHGSLHSDIWHGPAVELALTNNIAIYPVMGWWKKNTAMKLMNSVTRYCLLVSLRAPEIDVDLLTPIENQITTPTTIQVDI